MLFTWVMFLQNSHSGNWFLGKVSESFVAMVICTLWGSQEALPDGENSRVSDSCSPTIFSYSAFPFPFTSNIIMFMTQTIDCAMDICPKQGEKKEESGEL